MLLIIYAVFPLYWMIITSLKTPAEVAQYPPSLIPSKLSFINYLKILQYTDIEMHFVNSLIVALGTTTLALMVSAPCAYSLGRFRYRSLNYFAMMMLFVYMMPAILIVIPLFIVAYRLRLSDNLLFIIFIHLSHAIPIGTWLLRSYFLNILGQSHLNSC